MWCSGNVAYVKLGELRCWILNECSFIRIRSSSLIPNVIINWLFFFLLLLVFPVVLLLLSLIDYMGDFSWTRNDLKMSGPAVQPSVGPPQQQQGMLHMLYFQYNYNPSTVLTVRDRLCHALFVKVSQSYSRRVPPSARAVLEYALLAVVRTRIFVFLLTYYRSN